MSSPLIQVLPDPAFVKRLGPTWTKVAINLFRHANGSLYVKAKVLGKPFSKVLGTTSVETAKRQRDALLLAEHKRRQRVTDATVTMGTLMDQLEKDIEADSKLKPRSKDYRIETLKQLKATWPDLYGKKISEVNNQDCEAWAKKARDHYGPTRFNGTLETLRRLLKRGMEKGLLDADASKGIERASVPITQEDLPDLKDIQRLLAELNRVPDITDRRKSFASMLHEQKKAAANVLKFMLYTGCRIGATPEVTPANIDLTRNEVVLPKIKYDDRPVRVPIFTEALPFFQKLLAERKGDGPLFSVKNPAKVLAAACRAIGIPVLTCHNMRDLFATVALMHTKDVALVATWLGHKDKGVTLLKRYAHLLNDYSQQQAKKVTFAPTIETGVGNQSGL